MRHHTKDKGDLAVAEVIADLTRYGAHICLPLSEHLPFDLIAISPSMREVRRVQVKYGTAKRGTVRVALRGTHADRHGVHHRRINLDEIDCFAVYCPDTDKVYYVLTEEVLGLQCEFCLRVTSSKNGQSANTRPAERFVPTGRIFGPVAQWIERMPSKHECEGSTPSGPASAPPDPTGRVVTLLE